MWKLQVSCKCALQLVWAGYCSWLELKVHACVLNGVRLFVTPWTVARQVPLSVEFSRQEFWSGLPFPTPGHIPDPGIELMSLAHTSLRGGFFTTVPHGKPSTLSVPLFKNSCVQGISLVLFGPVSHQPVDFSRLLFCKSELNADVFQTNNLEQFSATFSWSLFYPAEEPDGSCVVPWSIILLPGVTQTFITIRDALFTCFFYLAPPLSLSSGHVCLFSTVFPEPSVVSDMRLTLHSYLLNE